MGPHCVKQRVLTRLWRFRHLNIVGCLLKKALERMGGGGVVTGTGGSPTYALVLGRKRLIDKKLLRLGM